ncbi:MAG: hypothetical protein WD404_04000 [Solirubrobacterales bacterium]
MMSTMPASGDRPKMGLADQVLGPQRLGVTVAHTAQAEQRGKHPAIILLVVGDEEVDVLGGADEAVRDHGEAPDHDEASALTDHRGGGDIKLRIECAHRPAPRHAADPQPERRDAVRGAAARRSAYRAAA